MKSFIRFETGRRCAQSSRPLGVFRTAGYLEELADIPDWTAERLRETLDWFNENLMAPKCCEVQSRGLFWFRNEEHEVVQRMWDLATILRDEGIYVDMRQTNRPGRIVYEDKQQIAAIPELR